MAELAADIRALRARIDEQEAELAALRTPKADRSLSRRHLLTGLASVGAAGAAGVVAAQPAAAANGDPLVLGQSNVATATTTLTMPATQVDTDILQVTSIDSWHTGLVVTGPETSVRAADGYTGLRVSGPFNGVWAEGTGTGVALYATAIDDGAALIASAERGPAIGSESVDGVTLYLKPAGRVGPPTTGPRYPAGSVSVDQDNEVWISILSGTPGTWTRLLREDTAAGRVIPITPLRVLDTRRPGGKPTGGPIVAGQTQGPIASLQTVTLDVAGVAPIPGSATGLIGNATVVAPTGSGYLRVFPAGTAVTTSTVNFLAGAIIANSFTCALSATGIAMLASVSGAGAYHLVIDITAYIT